VNYTYSQIPQGINILFSDGQEGNLVFGVGAGCVVSAKNPEVADRLFDVYTEMKSKGEVKCQHH